MSVRILSLSTFALVSLSLALGGCAAEASDDASVVAEADVSTTSPDTIVAPVSPIAVGPDVLIVAPECRAVLVSTGPATVGSPSEAGCAASNPYIGQRRYAGYLESGLTAIVDEARPGHLICTPSQILGGGIRCTKTPDLVVEKLCTQTLTFSCPCGVETVNAAGECRRFPQ